MSYSGLPRWLSGKESACNAGDVGLIPEWRRSPREGNGGPFHYSCLGNPMDRGAWWATIRGLHKNQMQLSVNNRQIVLVLWSERFHLGKTCGWRRDLRVLPYLEMGREGGICKENLTCGQWEDSKIIKAFLDLTPRRYDSTDLEQSPVIFSFFFLRAPCMLLLVGCKF